MVQQDVLARLLVDQDLRIDPVTSVVQSRRQGKWRTLSQRPDSHDSGYRFVEVSYRGMKKRVGVHVLQWMQATGALVPAGFDVHHKRSPPRPLPKDNALSNLELLPWLENQGNWQANRELDPVPF